MKTFEPLITYLSPLRTAVVRIADTSEPASGSVRQKEASLGSSVSMPRYLALTFSEPPSSTGAAARSLAPSVVAIAAQPQASSSPISAPSAYDAPAPPYSVREVVREVADVALVFAEGEIKHSVAFHGERRRSCRLPLGRELGLEPVLREAHSQLSPAVMQGLVESAARRLAPLRQHVDRDVVER